MDPENALEKEMAAYQAELPKLLSESGKFVVFFESKNYGVFATYNEALTKGYEVAKDKPFLVEQISALPPVQHFSRSLDFNAAL